MAEPAGSRSKREHRDPSTVQGALKAMQQDPDLKERARQAALAANKRKQPRNRDDIEWYTEHRED